MQPVTSTGLAQKPPQTIAGQRSAGRRPAPKAEHRAMQRRPTQTPTQAARKLGELGELGK